LEKKEGSLYEGSPENSTEQNIFFEEKKKNLWGLKNLRDFCDPENSPPPPKWGRKIKHQARKSPNNPRMGK